MKSQIEFLSRSNSIRSLFKLSLGRILLIIVCLTSIQVCLKAQEQQYTKPLWWFGLAAGANLNYYRGSTQNLNADLTVPTTFHNGNSVGLYVAPLLEYRFPNSDLGISMHVGYDGRGGSFNQVITPCNCPADLKADLSYLTIEPSLRFAPFNSGLYLFGGPRFAFNLAKSFTYKLGINPQYPDQTPTPDVNEDFNNVRKSIVSLQIGAGYDIPLSSEDRQVQYVLSPFISFQPYFGQSPRSIETWNLTTLRVGAALKFGFGTKILAPAKVEQHESMLPDYKVAEVDSTANFSIKAPASILDERKVIEMFPIRNYVFFDRGFTAIPGRYVLLNKDQAKNFKENQLSIYTPNEFSNHSERQLKVYYNVLNIVGYRMQNNPAATINLIGSSEKGLADGQAMAESIKKYLVDVYEIKPLRINTEGREKPLIPSGPLVDPDDLVLLQDGDRRVSIENSTPNELTDLQSNLDIMLKPVDIIAYQKAPLDSYVSFYLDKGKSAYKSWSLEIKNEKGDLQKFGPYTEDSISMPGKTILGADKEGDYKVTMISIKNNGDTVRKQSNLHLTLYSPRKVQEGLRYSVIFEFDEANLIPLYEKHLRENVLPNIPKGSSVIIHGYTDIIGLEAHNKELSLSRSNNVMNFLKNGLAEKGINDVKFEIYGFGEDQKLAPFENKYPEQNFYNRTVMIDIIPAK